MQPGKLSQQLLASLLTTDRASDPGVVLGPGIGRDAAVIDTGGPKLLVAKADPITFAADRIGWYAVHVNANDIACLGARPRWFMATIFLPEGASSALVKSIFRQITRACSSLGVALVGGHTEVTVGLDRPIVAGAMLGEVERGRLVRPDGARAGDSLILAGGIAVEGTSVLAREAGEALRSAGVSARTVAAARKYLIDPGISVVAAAETIGQAVRVHAMHDPTEGGLATALYEMAEASKLGIVVQADQIDVLPATRKICAALDLDPLGLLASGSLLIATEAADEAAAMLALSDVGVSTHCIGKFVQRRGVIMISNNQRRPVPRFERDEVARFLSTQG
jgi:hydrogenase maturation factor